MSNNFTASLEISVPNGVSREQIYYYLQNLPTFTGDIKSVQHIKVNRIVEEKHLVGTSTTKIG
jgi:hypothetical protein